MLRDCALLISVSLHYPPTTKTDKGASEDLTRYRGTATGKYRAVKELFPKSTMKAIKEIDGQIEAFHKKETAPWSEKGERILLTCNHGNYMQEIRQYRRRRDDAVYDFEREYPAILAQAQSDLRGDFDRKDYPSVSQIRECFKFTVNSSPIPDAADFRIDLPGTEMAELRAGVERRIRDAEDLARIDLAKQIIEPVAKLVEKLNALNSDDVRMYECYTENIADIADRIPRLNVTGDPVLASLASRLKSDLTRHPVKTLKENKIVRQSVKKRAQDILDTMSVFMGPVSQELAA